MKTDKRNNVLDHCCPKTKAALSHPAVCGAGESSNPSELNRRRPNVNASCSIFSQILQLIPRHEFEVIVKQTGAQHVAE